MLVIGGKNIYTSCSFREQLLSQLLMLAESHFGWALLAGIPNNDKSFSSAEASLRALSIFPLLLFLLRYPAGASSFSNMPLACSRLRDSGEKSFQVARVLFSLCSLNTSPLYYLRAWHRLNCEQLSSFRLSYCVSVTLPLLAKFKVDQQQYF